jgi:hypothetical protein
VTSVRILALFSVLALAAACKGKPKHQEPATSVETAAGSATKGAAPAPNLDLPKGPGTPPVKTTAPLGAPQFQKLGDMKFPGFLWNPKGNDKTLTVKQETETRPKIKATITVEPCNNDCLPMELPKWQEKTDSLKEFLAPALKDAKDTVFEVGQTDLYGQPMIYTYQLGQAMKPEGGGAYTNAYVLYYNDGVNKIRVMAAYTDDPKMTKEDMAKDVPKEDLEKVAKAFVDVYTHAWAS